jgi:hypothetical protein
VDLRDVASSVRLRPVLRLFAAFLDDVLRVRVAFMLGLRWDCERRARAFDGGHYAKSMPRRASTCGDTSSKHVRGAVGNARRRCPRTVS